jgi:hypothetical protein
MGAMNLKRPTAIIGTMNHAKTSLSTEIFAGAIISLVQCLVPLCYCVVASMCDPEHEANIVQRFCSVLWHPGFSKVIDLWALTW